MGKGASSSSVSTSLQSHTVSPQRRPRCPNPSVLFVLLAQPFGPLCLSYPCFVQEQRASRDSGGKGLVSRQHMPEPLFTTGSGCGEALSVCVARLTKGLMASTLVGCRPM